MASSTSSLTMLAAATSLLLLLAGVRLPAVSAQMTTPNITDILIKGGQYNTLLSLLTTTNLAPQLSSLINSSTEGVTVFAPTDAAFSALPPGALQALSTNAQINTLLYHVLPKFYTLNDLRAATSNPVRTVASGTNNGGGYSIDVVVGGSQVNLSTGVVSVPVGMALNVTRPLAVYSLGSVLLPAEIFGAMAPAPAPAVSTQMSVPNVTDILVKGGQYKTLLTLLTATNLTSQLSSLVNSSKDGVTIFAPTDSAFSALPPGALEALSRNSQVNILLYHVLPKFYTVDELRTAASSPIETVATGANGGGYTIDVMAGAGQVNLSTGVVVVPLGAELNVTRPLAVYSLGSVLLPVEIFGPMAPTPAPGPVSGGPSPPGTSAAAGMMKGGVQGWCMAVGVAVTSSWLAAV